MAVEPNSRQVWSFIQKTGIFMAISDMVTPNAAIWKDEVLVTTKSGKYTANDMEKLFKEAGNALGYKKYKQVRDLSYENGRVPPPNVPTHCYYGVGQDTPLSFDYSKCENFPDCSEDDFTVKMDPNGDGLVNYKGSTVCLDWADSGYKLKTLEVKATHTTLRNKAEVRKAIAKVVGATPTSRQGRGSVHDEF